MPVRAEGAGTEEHAMASRTALPWIQSFTCGLALTAGAGAATITVGPGGDHATIQAAINAAVASPGGDNIKVARGTYHERLLVDTLSADDPGTLTISGGWDAAFIRQDPDPNLTIVDADRLGRALHVICGRGAVEFLHFTLREGFVDASAPEDITGAGALLRSGCRITLRNNAIIGGLVRKTGSDTFLCACGGGVSIVGGGGITALIDNTISANEVRNEAAGGDAFGAGVWVEFAAARAVVVGNVISDNIAEALNGTAHSGGVWAELLSNSDVLLSDNALLRNRVLGAMPATFFGASGATLVAGPSGEHSRVEARRNRLLENRGGRAQLQVRGQNSEILLSDILVAGGDADALELRARESEIRANNLTVTDNAGRGLVAEISPLFPGEIPAEISVANSIVFGNGAPDETDPAVLLDSNLTSDPLFVDPAAGDYHVRLDSAAVNAGNNSPLGGLGPLDLDRERRLQGPRVDIGAYETDEDSGGSGGLCRLRDDSAIPFVPGWAPACRCLRDDGLRSLRCGGLGPGLFMEVMIPLPLVAGQPSEGIWTLHPWTSAADGSYALSSSLLVGQKEEPVFLKGKGTGKLGGKDVGESLRFTIPFAPATLRTTLQLFPSGANAPFDIEMDVLLAVPPPRDPS